MSDSRREIVRSAAVGAVVGLAALGGLWSSSLASLALVASPLVHIALLVFGVRLVARLWRGRSAAPQLIGIAVALAAELLLVGLLFRVPSWVKSSAAPVLAALEHWKRGHGRYPGVDMADNTFPAELRTVLVAARCPLYEPGVDGYRITCLGVAFTKCTYDATTDVWTAWD
jgi:hypothetical protein